MDENKKKTLQNIEIAVLSILIIAMIVLIIYMVFIKKDDDIGNNNDLQNNNGNSQIGENDNSINNNQDNNEEIIDGEELNLDSNIVKELLNKIDFIYGEYSNKSKDCEDYVWYFYENKNINLNNISNNIKLELGVIYLSENNIIRTDDNNNAYFNVKDLDKAIKSIFGENVKYNNDDTNDYKYDENSQKYIENIWGCGGDGTSPIIKTKLNKAIEKDDEIILYEKFIYAEADIENYPKTKIQIYKDLNKNNLVDELDSVNDYNDSGVFIGYDNIDISKYYDKISMVKYTFKKDNNNSYYFYSSQIID